MMVRLLIALMLAGLAVPGFAQSNNQATAAAPAVNSTASLSSAEIERLRGELDLKRENAVLQARNDLAGEAYSRLESLLGAFGILITILAIVFGLSTREAAIAKAKEGVEAIRREMEQLRDETRQVAETHIERLRAVETEASVIMDKLRTGEIPEDPRDRQTVLDAAKLADAKRPNERSIEDLKALLTASLIDRDWEKMRSHASALLYLFGDNEKVAAEASVNLAYALHELGRTEEALQVNRQLLARFGQSADPDLVRDICLGTFNCGVYLTALARPEEAIAAYDEVIARFGDSTELALRERVAKSLLNKGATLGSLDKSEEAIAVYDDLSARFGEATEPALCEWVAKALLNKGITFGTLNKSEDEIAIYDEILARFGDSAEPALREQVAVALVSKGVALGALNRSEDEIAIYEEVVARFGDTTEPALCEWVAKALLNKGITLGMLNKPEDEVAVYEDVIARFADSAEPALCEQVAKALLNKGLTLGSLNKPEEEIAIYDEMLARFGDSAEPALREQVATALFNNACVRARAGDVSATIDALRRWYDHAASFNCEMVAEDEDFDAVRGDPSFVALLEEMGCTKKPRRSGSRRKPKGAGS
jgi:tetratricopeptide (TPR) repeat protein